MNYKIFLTLTVAFLFALNSDMAVAASFQNGNFDTGDFSGWSGEISDRTTFQNVDPNQSTYFNLIHTPDPNFLWIAEISLDDTYWLNTLYQNFTLDNLPPANRMTLTFWVNWLPTDSNQDYVSITLEDANGNRSIDLLDGVQNSDLLNGTWITQDITDFAASYGGQDVELAFSISDMDFKVGDTLAIDNISIETNPVPLPSSLLFLAPALGMIGLFKKRQQ